MRHSGARKPAEAGGAVEAAAVSAGAGEAPPSPSSLASPPLLRRAEAAARHPCSINPCHSSRATTSMRFVTFLHSCGRRSRRRRHTSLDAASASAPASPARPVATTTHRPSPADTAVSSPASPFASARKRGSAALLQRGPVKNHSTAGRTTAHAAPSAARTASAAAPDRTTQSSSAAAVATRWQAPAAGLSPRSRVGRRYAQRRSARQRLAASTVAASVRAASAAASSRRSTSCVYDASKQTKRCLRARVAARNTPLLECTGTPSRILILFACHSSVKGFCARAAACGFPAVPRRAACTQRQLLLARRRWQRFSGGIVPACLFEGAAAAPSCMPRMTSCTRPSRSRRRADTFTARGAAALIPAATCPGLYRVVACGCPPLFFVFAHADAAAMWGGEREGVCGECRCAKASDPTNEVQIL
eukprot:Rhum_TRINITY_DN12789_c1_g4::Rhum_TRINITY_DN12789_c1_g4_i1::g.54414::m.54414